VRVFPVDTTAIGGTSFPLHSVVTDSSDGVIAGVPVGYRLSDATRGSVTPAYLSASFTAAATVRDSVWVVAETPTHLRDSTRIHIIPPAAILQKVSGDAQTAVLGAVLKNPLVVRVLDALNGGFRGDTVRWTVTTANATLTAPFSVSDDTGYALVSLTPSALGPVTVQAAVAGLSGSPQTFTVTSTAGTVRQVIISPKFDTIARGLTVQYTAVAKDQFGNVVSTPFNWVSTVQTIAKINRTTSSLTPRRRTLQVSIRGTSRREGTARRTSPRLVRTTTTAPITGRPAMALLWAQEWSAW
jgi:hypothetical protein